MHITGILSVSNGTGLKYPFTSVASNLESLCDDVIVGLDPAFPKDFGATAALESDTIHITESPWNLSNREGGHEIAMQMDGLVKMVEGVSDWVVVLQADEFLHERDFDMLRSFMQRHQFSDTTGFITERIYFWKDLKTIRKDWNADLIRIFKPGYFSFMADGTSKDGMYSGAIKPGETVKLPYSIYHYSRVDTPANISRRVRNLDGFFHAEEELIPVSDLPEYDFATREFDNFSKIESPPLVNGNFCRFEGTHPRGVEEWFNPPFE